jgi:transcription elongation factor GreA-like protein
MAYYALIKDNTVANTIKADEKYIELIAGDYDDVYEIVDGTKPSPGSKAIQTTDGYVFSIYGASEKVDEVVEELES